jgi:hypothetical protein
VRVRPRWPVPALILALAVPLPSLKADTSVGAAYLLRGVSPQEDALGGGALADYGNAAAQWENPAVLAGVGKSNLTLSEEFTPLDGNTEYVAASLGLGKTLAQHLGIQAYYRGTDDSYRNSQGVATSSFMDMDALAGLSYALHGGPWSLGVGLKALTESLAGQSARPGYLGDLGIAYLPDQNLLIAAALRNIGSVPDWVGESPYRPESLEFSGRESLPSFPGPRLYEFLGLEFPDNQAPLSTLESSDPQTTYGAGIDYIPKHSPWVVRASYTAGDTSLSFPYGFSAGFGLTWSGIEFDYTYSALGALGSSNILGLCWTPSAAHQAADTDSDSVEDSGPGSSAPASGTDRDDFDGRLDPE